MTWIQSELLIKMLSASAASMKLPEELWESIFENCDSTPPSITKARLEPSLNLTKSADQTLKNVSVVSRAWRRIVLRLLFQYTCLQLDLREWAEEVPRVAKRVGKTGNNVSTSTSADAQIDFTDHTPLIPSAIKDFCDFVRAAQLASSIQSFVLVIDNTLQSSENAAPTKQGRAWPTPAAAAAMWEYTLSTIDPGRVVAMAPPDELSRIVSPAPLPPYDGDWVWKMTNLQIFELRQKQDHTPNPGGADLRSFALKKSRYGSCLFVLREWQHLGLNEGSFLKAYATYDYFERGAPLRVHSIARSLEQLYYDGPSRCIGFLSSVRSLTYTAIFPFAWHTRPIHWLPYPEIVDVQSAPDPQSGMLDDKSQTGRADLQDCWRELLSVYRGQGGATSVLSTRPSFRLRKMICRDAQIPALKEDIAQAFIGGTAPRGLLNSRHLQWSEDEPGVFIRHAPGTGSQQD